MISVDSEIGNFGSALHYLGTSDIIAASPGNKSAAIFAATAAPTTYSVILPSMYPLVI